MRFANRSAAAFISQMVGRFMFLTLVFPGLMSSDLAINLRLFPGGASSTGLPAATGKKEQLAAALGDKAEEK